MSGKILLNYQLPFYRRGWPKKGALFGIMPEVLKCSEMKSAFFPLLRDSGFRQVTHKVNAPLKIKSDLKSVSIQKTLGGQGFFLFYNAVNNIHSWKTLQCLTSQGCEYFFFFWFKCCLFCLSAYQFFSPAQVTDLVVTIMFTAVLSHVVL